MGLTMKSVNWATVRVSLSSRSLLDTEGGHDVEFPLPLEPKYSIL